MFVIMVCLFKIFNKIDICIVYIMKLQKNIGILKKVSFHRLKKDVLFQIIFRLMDFLIIYLNNIHDILLVYIVLLQKKQIVMLNVKYKHIFVNFIKLGEAEVLFRMNNCPILALRDIVLPIASELGMEEYMIPWKDVTNIIGNQFAGFPKNQNNVENGYLTIMGTYKPADKIKEKEAMYIDSCNDDIDYKLIIKGINGKAKLEDTVRTINEKMSIIMSSIRTTLEIIKQTAIDATIVDELNS